MPAEDQQTFNPDKGYVALLGWSLAAVEAAATFDRRYVVVAPDWAEEYCTEERYSLPPLELRAPQRSLHRDRADAAGRRRGCRHPVVRGDRGVGGCHQLAVLLDNPRLFGQAMLLRDKALMKRRAQLGGVSAWASSRKRTTGTDVIRFLKRVNQTLLKLDGDPNDPIHLKAFDKAGCLGHRVIRTPDEVDT
jgi:hypothetical protein